MNTTFPASTVEWLAAVRTATSEEALVVLMRRYVESRDFHELARIAADIRPRAPEGRTDILESAVALAREELKLVSTSEEAETLRQMAAVFAEASLRLTRMDRGVNTDPRTGE